MEIQKVDMAGGITTFDWRKKKKKSFWFPKTRTLPPHEEKPTLLLSTICNLLTHTFILMGGCQVI